MNTVHLTPAQRDIWAAQRLAAQPAHHLCRVLDLTGAGSPAALQSALDRLVADWPALRLGVLDDAGRPRPFLRSEASTGVRARRLPPDTDLNAAIAQAMAEPFDLDDPPMLRAHLLESRRGSGSGFTLVVVAHHLVVDGIGFNRLVSRLLQEWVRCERGADAVAVAPAPAIRRTKTAPRADAAYWLAEFGDDLVQSLPEREGRTPTGGLLHRRDLVGRDLDARLRMWARRHGHSHASVLLTVFAATLHRWSDAGEVVLTSQVSLLRRGDADISMATTTVPVHSRLSDQENAPGFAQRTRERFVAALRHRDEPFADVLGLLRPARRPDGTSVFADYEFNHMPAWRPPADLQQAGWRVTEVPVPDPATQYAVTLSVVDGGDHTALRWHADGRRLDQTDLDTVAAVFLRLLTAVTGGDVDTAPLTGLHVVGQAEHDALHRLGTGPAATVPLQTVTERFMAQPAALTALRRGSDSLTYEALAGLAGGVQVALTEHGVTEGDRVAVHLRRGPALIAAQLAIWGLGAVYVPVDVANPEPRMLQMLDQTGPAALLTDQDLSTGLRSRLRSSAIAVLRPHQPPSALVARPAPSAGHPAYVLFTSGSTGAPKGVEIGLTAMNNHLEMMLDIGIGADDCIAQNAPLGFDVHVWQCVAALTVGASVRIVDDGEARDPLLLAQAVAADQVTVLEAVPSLLDVLGALAAAGALDTTMLRPLRHLLPTGEPLPMELCRRLLELLPDVSITNAYGPAEAADDITLHQVHGDEPGHTAPLGPAARNVRLSVLDQWQRHRPHGYAGEIAVAGLCVGNGYIGPDVRPAFGPDPCGAGLMYRTGDIGYLDDSGVVHYLGRQDHQVKVGGRRIETGEVAAALRAVDDVDAAAVVCVRRRGHATLVAFVTSTGPITEADLKADLAARLPSYMVPARIVVRSELPVTGNGKSDRRALEREATDLVNTDSAPAGGTGLPLPPASADGSPIDDAWRAVLGAGADLDRGAGFFALGGDSFTALELVARLDAVGVTTDIGTLYANQSLDAFVRAVASSTTACPAAAPLQGVLPSAVLPMAVASATACPPVVAVRFDPWLIDVDTLAVALDRVVAGTVALRLAIHRNDDGEWRYALRDGAVRVPVIEAAADDGLLDAAAGALDSKAGVNLVGAYLRHPDGRLTVLLAAAHVVIDVAALSRLVDLLAAVMGQDPPQEAATDPHADSDFLRWLATLQELEPAKVTRSVTAPAADRGPVVHGNATVSEAQSLTQPTPTHVRVELPASAGLEDLDAALLTTAILLSGRRDTAVAGVWRELDGRPLVPGRSALTDAGCYTLLTPALTENDLVHRARELPPSQALPLVRRARVTAVDRGRLARVVAAPPGVGVIVNILHQPVRFSAASLPTARLVPAVTGHNARSSPHLVHIDAHIDPAEPGTATLTVTFHPATSAPFRRGWLTGLRDGVPTVLTAAASQAASAGTASSPPGADLLGLSPTSLNDLLNELEAPSP
ncbi:amino acid adenylation domain-containing protein [Streptomyces echinatus]|uniref:Amino acid adenylation domain-containing protein n=1 Tax=Streptomyces echinatus TaxID=67293 RepID=A0A7W9PRL8_9ACTN|nr:amino acid adenylation domain-containing protein [Streptomyces echinatus]MBB5926576.1 amino acid adenylation domain-containing protein [Streptomyces echinatus]